MVEHIKFSMESDEVLSILQESSDVENEFGKEYLKSGLKEEAMEHFKNEAVLEIAIKAVKKQVPVQPIHIAGRCYRCGVCNNFVVHKAIYCDNCGQRLYW